MQKILVTGANSFVGKHLIPYLINSGHEVQGIVRKTSSTLKASYQSKSLSRPNLVGDLSDREFINSINWSPDIIIHLAANSNVNADVSRIFKDNVTAARNILEFAKRIGCPKLIAISTVSVHGKILQPVISESTGFIEPNIYGFTKRSAELLFLRDSNLKSTYILRLPAVLGVGASKHWISRVFVNAIKNNEIEIHNPNSLFNNVIAVRDLLKFLEQLIKRLDVGSFTFPLASSTPIKVRELVELIIQQSNSQSKVIVSENLKSSFTIDDRFARNKFSYDSLSVSDAVSYYVKDSLSTIRSI